MYAYIIRRLFWAIGVLFIVATVAFFLVHFAPGDPTVSLLGLEARPEAVERLRQQLGLDKPLYVQYFDWFKGLLRGDMGNSIYLREPVLPTLLYRLRVTLSVATGGLIISILLGVPAGVISAVKYGSWIDRMVMFSATIGVSIPAFWLGLNLILVFAAILGWLPSGGFAGFVGAPIKTFKQLILPCVSIGVINSAVLARMTRSSMLDVLGKEYVKVARAKGLTEFRVIIFHAFRNSVNTVLTVIGIIVGVLIGRAMIIDIVFTLPGIGRLMINSVTRRDIPMLQGLLVFSAFIYASVNIVVDLLYAFADPRIRYD